MVQGLDLLGALDSINKHEIVDFIYSTQISKYVYDMCPGHGGFIGSSYLGLQPSYLDRLDKDTSIYDSDECMKRLVKYTQGHMAMTYTALAILVTLGDDMSRLEKESILAGESL